VRRFQLFCASLLVLAACQHAPAPVDSTESGGSASQGAGQSGGGTSPGQTGRPPGGSSATPDNSTTLNIPGPNGRVQAPYPFQSLKKPDNAPPPPPARDTGERTAGTPSINHIIESLEAGREDAAAAEIQRLLAVEPGNRAAMNLQHQINDDPVAVLGQESYPYTIRPGDSMSSLARRFLGDGLSFYLLARYNDIKVPKQLAVGQTIKVPGKPPVMDTRTATVEPPPSSSGAGTTVPPVAVPPPVVPATANNPSTNNPSTSNPVPTPPPMTESRYDRAFRIGQEAEGAKDYQKALGAYTLASQIDPTSADAKAKVEAVRRDLVNEYTYTARSAFAKQDLDGAISYWDRVLGLDPSNETAKLERQKTITLRDKLNSIH
jgi:LysM repeat protein